MKRRLVRAALATLLLGIPSASPGQRPAPPAPRNPSHPAPRTSHLDSTTSDFTTGGVRVILRRMTTSDVVAVNLYLLGGTRQLDARTAGIELFLLAASDQGSVRYPTQAMRRAIARTGSTFTLDPTPDWTAVGFRGIRQTFDSTWAIFADRLMAPALDSASVERVRTQLLSAVRQRHDEPDALVLSLADSVAFEGHPYAIPIAGTESTVAALSRRDLRRYAAEQLVKSRMLLVVVGNIERARVERLVAATLGRLPRGHYLWALPPELPARPAPKLVVARRVLPTNYILGIYAGPSAASADYPAMQVASAILSGRLFQEVRTRRNLTYAIEAPLQERARASGGLYVTTVHPDSALRLAHAEIVRLQQEQVSQSTLDAAIALFITEYFLKNETNAQQADFLARAQLYRGDWRAASRFVSDLRRVTPYDVSRVARTYIKAISFAYVGDPALLSRRTIERFQ